MIRNFLAEYHSSSKRDYIARVVEHDKAECASVAKKWGRDYWDGDRKYGYGGNYYDGRWLPIAQSIAQHYGLKRGDKILDVGCGKGFLLYEFTHVVPGIDVYGLDISWYAIDYCKPEVQPYLKFHSCTSLPYEDGAFDFVYSINTLHNLCLPDLILAIKEIERVGKDKKWICVESWRNEREKANLLYWQLTCESFYRQTDWMWLMNDLGYTGDLGFVVFE
jgi:SAM-dependent methyltransferase